MALVCCAASWLNFAFLYFSWFSCRIQRSFCSRILGFYGNLWDFNGFCVILFSLIDFDFYIFIVDPCVESLVKPSAKRSWASRRVASLRWFVDWLVPWAIPGWWEPLWLVKDNLQEFFGVMCTSHKQLQHSFLFEVCEVLSDLWSQCLKRNCGRCLSGAHAFTEIPVRRSDAMEVPGGPKKGRGSICIRHNVCEIVLLSLSMQKIQGHQLRFGH